MAKVIPITERFQHFVEELQETFRTGLGTVAGWLCRLESLPTRAPESGWVSQRLLHTRFCHAVRNHPAADRASAGEELSAEGHRAVSAAGSGAGDAGARSVSARHFHATSGAGGGHVDWRASERAKRIAVNTRLGRCGAAVPSSALAR